MGDSLHLINGHLLSHVLFFLKYNIRFSNKLIIYYIILPKITNIFRVFIWKNTIYVHYYNYNLNENAIKGLFGNYFL